MPDEEIQIEIDGTGKVNVHMKGIKGEDCTHWAELLAQIVGREESRTMTSEFYESRVQAQRQVDVKRRK